MPVKKNNILALSPPCMKSDCKYKSGVWNLKKAKQNHLQEAERYR